MAALIDYNEHQHGTLNFEHKNKQEDKYKANKHKQQ